ncbi:hypothetical protein [Geobacter sp. AOG2]|uniref:NHL domain-containing protein n=1 Tax=Geobacter sp. AOG2 TaxID=1566347 RepID=UPI001CC6D050|nr:hypothetical protein [Geobacter sp. AOG2]GFE62568.1 hypothetical protein AOG2_31560 [Geobacter sp. AOG2]
MQKTMLLMAALVLSLFISGCGGGGASTSVVASTTKAITATEVSGQTFYVVPLKSQSYTAFQTYSGATSHDWYSSLSNPPDLATKQGTWSVSSTDGTLSFNDTSGNPVYTFTRVQVEPATATLGADKSSLDYWLVYEQKTQKNCRVYFDQTKASTYIASAVVQNGLMGGAIQKTALATTFANVSTVTGVTGTSGFSDYSTANGPPAKFGRPVGITTTDGSTFFALDYSNNYIRMLKPDSNGVMQVKTLKTSGGVALTLNGPTDITTDGTNLYVADTSNYVIRKITPDVDANQVPTGSWTMMSLAGTGASGSVDGTGNTTTTTGTARFAYPLGITTDGTNLYVTDNHAIRKVVISTGEVTTLAGSPGTAGSDNGTGTAARFNFPNRITTDGTNLYVTDVNNYAIRKVVIATGVVTKIAGIVGTSGYHDDAGVSATFSGPEGITTDGTYLYVTDWGRVVSGNPVVGQTVRQIELASGNYVVTTIAGVSGHVNVRDSSDNLPDPGGITTTQGVYFYCPAGITTDGTSLFVADSLNYTIRRIYN